MTREKRSRICPTTTTNARCLRREATVPEPLLWSRLRNGQIGGFGFRRQHPIGRYVVDFYCPAAKLVIELDGRSHDETARQDELRERDLQDQGYRIARYLNDEVLRNLDTVVEDIARQLGIEL